MTGLGGGVDWGAGREWRWDVALSFAGAQREYVEQVAETLQTLGVRCFYDADEQIELWGKYLAEELPVIYSEQAATVVVFVSAEYAARDWTRHERRAALVRAVRERREYVLPARFDDTPLPGLLADMVAIDLRGRTSQQFARIIADKLASLAQDQNREASAGQPPRKINESCRQRGAEHHDEPVEGRAKGSDVLNGALNERYLRELSDALGSIAPENFRDLRISDQRLMAARRALLAVGPMAATLHAAAEKETRWPRRYTLKQADRALETYHKEVTEKLSALQKVSSEKAAKPLCDDLARGAAALLTAYAQAIRHVT